MTATVSLDIFSGREPPQWCLDGAEAVLLADRISALPFDGQLPAARLGYSGVTVLFEGEGGLESATCSAGLVSVTRTSGETEVRRDPQRAVERWLLATGRGQYPELVTPLLRE